MVVRKLGGGVWLDYVFGRVRIRLVARFSGFFVRGMSSLRFVVKMMRLEFAEFLRGHVQ